ncbi:DNA-binding transcriptional LysR family regulator [Mesocricetibacter intestinalis]|uniref:DNA-binding transcriptional LysR family regulator n=1 Tax=Mesocricetibacter intestinalis TaxID=1521930 RepID=A0A4R6VKK2_9PAST|nr:LysR family transcriptional regulator [Mesocricetibacter intestinalis]TDQ59099.1 DNA-binding transcriptional LysR family regulator [Mesocricetibacter intestinalis]
MKITLKQLSVFTTVYRTGSATLAAEQLALSQSAVSSALQELERLLDTQLFERNGKKLIATEAAHKLYPQAISVLSQVADIENEFRENKTCLYIGASSTIGNYLLPPLISDFMRAYPNIEIILHVYNTKEICLGLKNFDYDLGFIEGMNKFDELIAHHWRQDELTLFSAAQSRFLPNCSDEIELSDLARIPLVLREKGSGTRETIEQLILSRLNDYRVLQLSHSEAIKQAVSYDFGIGCLSTSVLEDPVKLGKIRCFGIKGLKLQRSLWLIRHRNKHISPALQKFIDFCYRTSAPEQ